jgi:ankyrin repeat protein
MKMNEFDLFQLKEMIRHNQLKLIEQAIKEYNEKDFFMHALHTAARLGQIQVLELLLENGANVNELEGYLTPFYRALTSYQFKTADFLISHGADIENPDSDGTTDFLAVCYECESLEHVKYLYERGANIHVRDKDGRDALYFAMEENNLELFLYLLEIGVDINTEDIHGVSAIEHAIDYESEEVLNYALEKIDLLSDKNKKLINAYRLEKLFN